MHFQLNLSSETQVQGMRLDATARVGRDGECTLSLVFELEEVFILNL
jgi:hypothetical protein